MEAPKMFKDSDALAAYRLLEFPSETAQSWPVARRERGELPIRLLAVARVAGRDGRGAKKIAA
jgi:hypothetical protein